MGRYPFTDWGFVLFFGVVCVLVGLAQQHFFPSRPTSPSPSPVPTESVQPSPISPDESQ